MSTEKLAFAEVGKHPDLINPDPGFIPEEVDCILRLVDRGADPDLFRSAYHDILRLFQGDYPGYRACNTRYHDLEHTTDTVLAMARLTHGAVLRGDSLSGRSITLGLVAALLHDTGYIQTSDDTQGTGARYTLTHITRSIDFAERYLPELGCSEADFIFCRNCLLCTGVNVKMDDIPFSSGEERLTGQMLGSADLLGQMADRKYIEKLLFLYEEFQEGNVSGYQSAHDLLRKTLDFYRVTTQRLNGELGGVQRLLPLHFAARWKIDQDPYIFAIDRNMEYIRHVLASANGNYRDYLRRGGVVKWLREQGR